MRRLWLWILTAATVSVFSASPLAAKSLPGVSLEDAEKDDFFEFFALKKRAIDERDGLATHYFRPPARDDVVVCVDTDTSKSNVILQMSLIVGREFIDEPKTNIFARDLVKSFIEAATPAAGAAETASVVNEIFLRGSGLQNATVEKVPIEVDNSSQKNSVSKNQNNQANTEPQKVVYENIKKELADNQTVGSGKAGSSADIDSGASEKSTVNLDADANSNSTNSNSSDSNTKVFAKIPGEKKRTIDKDQRLIKVGSGPLKVGDTAIITSRNLPKLPEKISDSYKAFQGSLETVDTPITGAHLILKNHIVAKGRFLEVRVDLDSVKKAPKFDVVVDESPSNDNNEKNDK